MHNDLPLKGQIHNAAEVKDDNKLTVSLYFITAQHNKMLSVYCRYQITGVQKTILLQKKLCFSPYFLFDFIFRG